MPTRPPFRLPIDHADDDVLAKVFRGLGDPTRLRLLAALRDGGELTVGELVTAVGAPQPRVSSHLAALRWCGFVTSRREHRTVRYRIADDRVLDLVAAAQGVVADHRTPAVADATPPAAPVAAGDPPAAAVAAAPGLHVVFELGGEECALPVEQVREVMRHEPPRRVPSTLPGLLGVRDVRGALLGVHDLAAVLGHRAGEPASLLVVHDRLGRVAGLAAGRVRGVEAVPADALRPPGTAAPGVTAIAVGARGLVLVLDADALLAVLRGGSGDAPA